MVTVPLAKRLGLGSVLGYLFAGILIGPHVLNLVGEAGGDAMQVAEFGVVMMLFLVGLELQPTLRWKLRLQLIGLGGLQVITTAALLAIVGAAFGLGWRLPFAAGLILAMSSPAIVLQSLQEHAQLKTPRGESCFAVLLLPDIAVIPILALLPLLALPASKHAIEIPSDHGATGIATLPGWQQALLVIAVVLAS